MISDWCERAGEKISVSPGNESHWHQTKLPDPVTNRHLQMQDARVINRTFLVTFITFTANDVVLHVM